MGVVLVELEERINAVLSQFRGMRNSPTVRSTMASAVSAELHKAVDRGELETADNWEVVVADIYKDQINVEIRQKLPPQIEVKLDVKKPRGPSTPPDNDWETRLTAEEAAWCFDQMTRHSEGLYCVDNHRAAKIWKSSQMRRFRRLESYGCCGSTNFVAKRWNSETNRYDIYLLGYNHGH